MVTVRFVPNKEFPARCHSVEKRNFRQNHAVLRCAGLSCRVSTCKLFHRYNALIGHDVDQLARNHHHLADSQPGCVALHRAVCKGGFFHGGLVGPGGDVHRAA
ncbi:hypothetical protein SAMN02910291_01041 [Desulfovibrio desulfuricans]|uniref:Uncharacterized protein n=1 Tax=Desulfovibrio desulfuricans TaxID=876 RepID=A0AA94HS12_DESDE|nr:hypothetical protein SAMN02910291_01041 [Desulfovibrio desulfuricans]SPD36351.1 Hypothetical protein DSVG11_2269 [Desulfovibrio sp. G11]